MHGWSFLDERAFLGCTTNVKEEESVLSQGLLIYPNPNNGQFTIALENAVGVANITIYDLTGRVVANTPVNNLPAGSRVDVDLSTFGNGVYLVQYEENGTISTARVIVR